jgi:hypothetical protein
LRTYFGLFTSKTKIDYLTSGSMLRHWLRLPLRRPSWALTS